MSLRRIKRKLYERLYLFSIKKYRQTSGIYDWHSPNPLLTEHAILRYLERVKKIDIEATKAEIWTGDLLSTIHQYGGTGKFVVNGVRYTVVRGRILTVGIPTNKNTPPSSWTEEEL